MPPEHQQERLTLEINTCCWNVFRYHCGAASPQGEDLPDKLPRGAEQRPCSVCLNTWGVGRNCTEASLFLEKSNFWFVRCLPLPIVARGLGSSAPHPPRRGSRESEVAPVLGKLFSFKLKRHF
jgi:hypothetical protein